MSVLPAENKRISSRLLTEGFYALNGMSAKSKEISAVIARLPELGSEAVRDILVRDIKMLPCKCESLLDFFSPKGGNENTLAYLEMFRGMDKSFDRGLDALEKALEEKKSYTVDLTLFEGTEGEDGMIYEKNV